MIFSMMSERTAICQTLMEARFTISRIAAGDAARGDPSLRRIHDVAEALDLFLARGIYVKLALVSIISAAAVHEAGSAGAGVAIKNEMGLQHDMAVAVAIRKGDRTRQVFMDAGRRVFVRDGYLNAEISEIAKEAGKSNGTFYIYFENKSALLDAMVAEFYTVIGARFPEHDDKWYVASADEDWALVLQNIWDVFKSHGPMFHALSQASLVDEHFAKAYSEIRNRTRTDFINLLKTRQKQGLCRTLNVEYTATALETMILYSMNEWLAEGGRTLDRRGEKKALSALTGIFALVMSAG